MATETQITGERTATPIASGKVYRLTPSEGHTNLYRWAGEQAQSGVCLGVEFFVKCPLSRQVLGRWQPCPSWSANSALSRHTGARVAA